MVLAAGDDQLGMWHGGLPRAHGSRKPSVSEANEGLVVQKYVKV